MRKATKATKSGAKRKGKDKVIRSILKSEYVPVKIEHINEKLVIKHFGAGCTKPTRSDSYSILEKLEVLWKHDMLCNRKVNETMKLIEGMGMKISHQSFRKWISQLWDDYLIIKAQMLDVPLPDVASERAYASLNERKPAMLRTMETMEKQRIAVRQPAMDTSIRVISLINEKLNREEAYMKENPAEFGKISFKDLVQYCDVVLPYLLPRMEGTSTDGSNQNIQEKHFHFTQHLQQQIINVRELKQKQKQENGNKNIEIEGDREGTPRIVSPGWGDAGTDRTEA